MSEDNPWIDEVVYFGPREDLAEGGIAEVVWILATKEMFRYDDVVDMTSYTQNNDPECLTERGLDPSKKYIAIYNGDFLEPKIYEHGKSGDWPSIDQLLY